MPLLLASPAPRAAVKVPSPVMSAITWSAVVPAVSWTSRTGTAPGMKSTKAGPAPMSVILTVRVFRSAPPRLPTSTMALLAPAGLNSPTAHTAFVPLTAPPPGGAIVVTSMVPSPVSSPAAGSRTNGRRSRPASDVLPSPAPTVRKSAVEPPASCCCEAASWAPVMKVSLSGS